MTTIGANLPKMETILEFLRPSDEDRFVESNNEEKASSSRNGVIAPDGFCSKLSNGIMLYAFLQTVSPSHFDVKQLITTNSNKELQENWVLKKSNLRKVLRDLEIFYTEEESLSSSIDMEFVDIGELLNMVDINSIAKEMGEVAEEQLFTLCGYAVLAAVHCKNREIFVSRIMQMSSEKQVIMKDIIEDTMTLLNINSDVNNDSSITRSNGVSHDADHIDPLRTSLRDISIQISSSGLDISQLKSVMDDSQRSFDDEEDESGETSIISSGSSSLEDSDFCNEDMKNQLISVEINLSKKESELIATQDLYQKTQVKLNDTLKALAEKNRLLEDEIAVSQAQAQKLLKYEAMIFAFKEKIESVGTMNDQMHVLEDRSTALLEQMMQLKESAERVPGLEKKIIEYEETKNIHVAEMAATKAVIKRKDFELSTVSDLLITAEREKASSEIDLAATRELLEIRKLDNENEESQRDFRSKAREHKEDEKNIRYGNKRKFTTGEGGNEKSGLSCLEEENLNLMKKIASLESSLCNREIELQMQKIKKEDYMQQVTVKPPATVRDIIHRTLKIFAAPFVLMTFCLLTDLLVLSCPAPL